MTSITTGTMIAGRYVVESVLGQGGMGIVARARDPKLARSVAIKFLPAAFVGNAIARERLLREARAAAALSHSGIVHIYDVGEADDGGAFIVMELIEGTSLDVRVRDRSLSVSAALKILVDVAKTLAFAHRAGFVHRDIKPANIVIRAEDGRPVVLDFGLARNVSDEQLAPLQTQSTKREAAMAHAMRLTAQDAIAGTPAYLSPEQARNGTIDGRSDQFSLAIMAFELLTGSLPWSADSAAEIIAGIMLDPPRSILQIDPSLPAAIEHVLQKALAKEAADRYVDCDALARALEEVLEPHVSHSGLAKRTEIEQAQTLTTSQQDVAAVIHAKRVSAELLTTQAAEPETATTATMVVVSAAVSTTAVTTHSKETSAVVPSQSNGPSRVARVGTGAIVLVLITIWGANKLAKTNTPARREVAQPLSAVGSIAANTVVACPVFLSAQQPWLGGALGTYACERLAVWMGGDYSHTRIPAELLQLPSRPVDDARMEDPFSVATARGQSLSTAQTFGRVIDGVVTLRDGRTTVVLSLKSSDLRSTFATSEGSAEVPVAAVRLALDALVAQRVIAGAPTPDPEFARWYQVRSIRAALAIHEIDRWGDQRPDPSRCASFPQDPSELGLRSPLIQRLCAHVEPTPRALDSTSNVTVAATADPALLPTSTDTSAIARDARRRKQSETSLLGQSMLGAAEAWMWMRSGDAARAREAAYTAAELTPRYAPAWRIAMIAARALPQPRAALRALLAWSPTVSYAWSDLANLEEGSLDPTRRLNFLRRACTLSPGNASNETDLAIALMAAGQKEELRSVASRLRTVGPSERIAAEWLMIGVDGTEARFSAAVTRALAALDTLETFGVLDQQDVSLLYFGAEAAIIAGRERELGERFARRIVLAQPTRLGRNESWTLRASVGLCLLAPRLTAELCIARVASLVQGGHFRFGVPANGDALLRGAALAARQDARGAADAWRPLVASVSEVDAPMALLIAPIFDAAGEHNIAALIDAPLLASRAWNGAGMVHVRAAFRAHALGHLDEAAGYVRQVSTAWQTADCTIAHVHLLQRLLRHP